MFFLQNTVTVKGVTIVNMVVRMKSHTVCQSVFHCFTLTLLCMHVCICVCTHSILSSVNLHNSNESITDLCVLDSGTTY